MAVKKKTKTARKAVKKKSGKKVQRRCPFPKCRKLGFNGRTHPKHLPKEKRVYK